MKTRSLSVADYRCIVTITGLDENSAERILINDLDLSGAEYADLHIERHDDTKGIIARFDYRASERSAIMHLHSLLVKDLAYSTEIKTRLEILRMDEIQK